MIGSGGMRVEKYGITGTDDLNSRPQNQVNKFNSKNDGRIYKWVTVIDNIQGRVLAKNLERGAVTYHYLNQGGRMPEKQILPKVANTLENYLINPNYE